MGRWRFRLKLIWILCLLSILAGCESGCSWGIPHRKSHSASLEALQAGGGDTLDMLNYYAWLQQLNTLTRLQEYERVAHEFDSEKAQSDALRLSLLLSLSNEPFRDDQRAQRLLAHYLEAPGDGIEENRAFALLLLDALKEREQQSTVVGQLQDQLNDYHRVKHELRKERELRQKLEKQLNQLKAIEESLIKREDPMIRPSQETQHDDGKSQNPAGR